MTLGVAPLVGVDPAAQLTGHMQIERLGFDCNGRHWVPPSHWGSVPHGKTQR